MVGVEPNEQWMKEALALAERGRGWVEPNPMVGAVVVRGGAMVGRGWHGRFGGPHAEINALDDAGPDAISNASDLTMVVTLEPCAHTGKTPPCTDALIRAGVPRVVVAMVDPNPAVAGKGITQLRNAGIEVVVGVCEDQARRLNEPFVKRMTTGRPWVIAKWAQTLDGKIATATGDSKWISNDASRRHVHELRARVDAVVAGVGTVIADDPRLTARDVEVRRTARRVVVDRDLRTPIDAKITTCDQAPTTFVTRAAAMNREAKKVAAWRERGVDFFTMESETGQTTSSHGNRLPLGPMLDHLAEAYDATNVLVEGGAGLIGSLLDQDLVDQVLTFIAPKLVGDAAALDALTGLSCETIASARTLVLRDVARFGDDVMVDYRAKDLAPSPSGRGPG